MIARLLALSLVLTLTLGACEGVRLSGSGGSSSRPDVGVSIDLDLLRHWTKRPPPPAEAPPPPDAADEESPRPDSGGMM